MNNGNYPFETTGDQWVFAPSKIVGELMATDLLEQKENRSRG
jgi:hypothetical protein